MNITLRKANAIQISINDALKGISAETQVKINEFQEAEAEIARVNKELMDNIQRRGALQSALYEIRKSVSGANARVGIDSRLADVAHLEKEIQFYNGLAGKTVRESANVVAGRLDKIRNDKSENRRSIYGYNDTVDTSVLTREDVDGFRRVVAKTKKSKQKFQDEILELNVQTTIELSATAEATLAGEGLL